MDYFDDTASAGEERLKKELELWSEARHGRVPPLVVLSRLGPIALGVGGLLKLVSGYRPPTPFTLFDSLPVWLAFVCSALPSAALAVLDRNLDSSAWESESLWGPLHPIDTCEPERRHAFVRYPMSAYSSHALTAMGGLILGHAMRKGARAPMASGALGLSFLAMGLASFGWWASRRRRLHRIDNWLMETHLMAVGLAIGAASEPEREGAMVIAWVCYALFRLAIFSGDADLLVPSIGYWSATLYAIARTGGGGELWRLVAGLCGVFGGLTVKMVDTTGKGAWGTAAFHYGTAIGWALFWSWSQTLPVPRAVG